MRLLADPKVVKIFHFARSTSRCVRHAFGLGGGDTAALLHQDRLAPHAHLHRPARPQGSRPRARPRRAVQAAAILGLGAERFTRRPSSPMPPPTCCICINCATQLDEMLAREGPDGARGRLLRLLAHAGQPRFAWLAEEDIFFLTQFMDDRGPGRCPAGALTLRHLFQAMDRDRSSGTGHAGSILQSHGGRKAAHRCAAGRGCGRCALRRRGRLCGGAAPQPSRPVPAQGHPRLLRGGGRGAHSLGIVSPFARVGLMCRSAPSRWPAPR